MGDAEIGDFYLTVRLNNDIAGFDIAVNDPFPVSIVECFCDLHAEIDDLLGLEGFDS